VTVGESFLAVIDRYAFRWNTHTHTHNCAPTQSRLCPIYLTHSYTEEGTE